MCVRDPAFLGTLADRLQLFYRDTSRSTVKFKEASSIVTPGRRTGRCFNEYGFYV
jgi:hypothetical protein